MMELGEYNYKDSDANGSINCMAAITQTLTKSYASVPALKPLRFKNNHREHDPLLPNFQMTGAPLQYNTSSIGPSSNTYLKGLPLFNQTIN